ncbi:MAG: hypothetical protein ACAI34_18285 [Verrucomicrobium sp.]
MITVNLPKQLSIVGATSLRDAAQSGARHARSATAISALLFICILTFSAKGQTPPEAEPALAKGSSKNNGAASASLYGQWTQKRTLKDEKGQPTRDLNVTLTLSPDGEVSLYFGIGMYDSSGLPHTKHPYLFTGKHVSSGDQIKLTFSAGTSVFSRSKPSSSSVFELVPTNDHFPPGALPLLEQQLTVTRVGGNLELVIKATSEGIAARILGTPSKSDAPDGSVKLILERAR